MLDEHWREFKYFHKWEDWGNPELIDYWLVYELEKLRKYLGKPIIILCGTQGKHSPNSLHYVGKAVDCFAIDTDVIDFYLAAERFNFGGIGIYTWWKHKGLHLDKRPLTDDMPAARWASIREGEYIKLDSSFLKVVLC